MTVLLVVLLVVGGVAAVYWIGDGDLRRGRLRSIRRIRTARRRRIRPLAGRLDDAVASAWTRPVRARVERDLKRLADRVDRMASEADRFVAAERGLAAALAKLEDVTPDSWRSVGTGGGVQRRAARGGRDGLLSGLGIGLAGAAVSAGNGFLLYRYILPSSPGLAIIPAGADALTISLAFAVLPFLFGIAYYALYSAGRAMGLRVLGGVVMLLVVALATIEGAVVVLTLESLGIVDPAAWQGLATASLMGGTVALLPPLAAVLAHSAVQRLDRWTASRNTRSAHRAAERQDRAAGAARETVERLASAVQSLRGDVQALEREPAGRLLLQPEGRPTVERTSAVLRRIARAVGQGTDPTLVGSPAPAQSAGRVLTDLFALLVWFITAAGALALTADGLRLGAVQGVTGLMTAAAFAALAALLLGGHALRQLFTVRGLHIGTRGSALAVLLFGVAAVACSAVIGPLAAGAGDSFFAGRPLIAAGWLNLMILVAASASTRVRDGVAALAGAVTWTIALAARLVLGLFDLVLAILDRLMGGRSRPSGRRRSRRTLRMQETP